MQFCRKIGDFSNFLNLLSYLRNSRNELEDVFDPILNWFLTVYLTAVLLQHMWIFLTFYPINFPYFRSLTRDEYLALILLWGAFSGRATVLRVIILCWTMVSFFLVFEQYKKITSKFQTENSEAMLAYLVSKRSSLNKLEAIVSLMKCTSSVHFICVGVFRSVLD